jgi:nitrogen fixation protein NifQ
MEEAAEARPADACADQADLGLSDERVRAAVARFSAGWATHHFAEQIAERRVEYDALVEMLQLGATPWADPTEVEVVAHAIAAGCLGERHLWRDLELPSRSVLRGLFEGYFEPFAADNTMDMRWKKYVYRKLCRWGGFHTCKAPSCGECSSYAECFGAEA